MGQICSAGHRLPIPGVRDRYYLCHSSSYIPVVLAVSFSFFSKKDNTFRKDTLNPTALWVAEETDDREKKEQVGGMERQMNRQMNQRPRALHYLYIFCNLNISITNSNIEINCWLSSAPFFFFLPLWNYFSIVIVLLETAFVFIIFYIVQWKVTNVLN